MSGGKQGRPKTLFEAFKENPHSFLGEETEPMPQTPTESAAPELRVLSLGAGVQSTALLLMSVYGDLPKLDAAIFADTGWEPAQVYEHLERITAEAERGGVPVIRVSKGNLRADAIDPAHRFASIPYFTKNEPGPCKNCDGTGKTLLADTDLPDSPDNRLDAPRKCPHCGGTGQDDGRGIGRRQCTSEYKLAPINRKIREMLGAAPPDYRRVPKGRRAEQWIGFSADEIGRVNDRSPGYIQVSHPLIDLGMDRKACQRWLDRRGWTSVTKSDCIGCPYHGNKRWRDLRDNHPGEWADAVEFDRAIRKGDAYGGPLRGEAFLHRSLLPLDQAPIDRVTSAEWRSRQVDLLDLIADAEEEGQPDGCSPYGCRSGEEVA